MTEPFSRRGFLGAAGALAGANLMSASSADPSIHLATESQSLAEAVEKLVAETPFVDTHEHLWDESLRIRTAQGEKTELPAPDFSMLLCHYTDSDVQSAGMSSEDYRAFRYDNKPLDEKWRMIAPYYQRCRHTGYQLCIRESLQALFNETDLREDNHADISEKLRNHAQPGFYSRILRDVANIEYCHVNDLREAPFRRQEYPELMAADISINCLCVPPEMDALRKLANGPVRTLAQAHAAIDNCFAKYASQAIAVKSQCAYWRSLDFPQVPEKEAAPLFKRFAADKKLDADETEQLQAHLFHYVVDRATEHRLPVKLHTGYYAGVNSMPLHRVRNNAADLCPTFKAHPNAVFSLFHIAYPYQDEVIALAKQYSNVYVDMCWAWIINPVASVRFLKEFLLAAPACKLFTFGGDYLPVELVVGHAAIARRGIAQAITELVQEKWLSESDVPELAARIMNGNAHEQFDLARTLA